MPHMHKIATCCYCGTRAALVLKGKTRHELACATCGAPLHDLKMLPTDRSGARELVRPSPVRTGIPLPVTHRAPKDRARGKRGRSMAQRIMGKIWDEAEDVFDDIFDDLFDIFD